MPTTSAGYSSGTPGFTTARTSNENSVLWQSFFQGDVQFAPAAVIDSTAVDSGSTPTSLLRAGLVMAILDATGEWVDYDADASDGSELAQGILVNEVYLLDYTAAASADRSGHVIVIGGKAITSRLICDGGTLTLLARRQLQAQGFKFDDDYQYPAVDLGFARVENITDGSETLTIADHGKLFVATNAAAASTTFTLPAIATSIGFVAEFYNNKDQDMVITSAENNNILVDGDLLAGTLTFSTASHKIGSRCRLEARYIGTTAYWFFTNLGGTVVTPT